MKITHLIAIFFIFAASCVAWFVLGAAMHQRTFEQNEKSSERIAQGWGPTLAQAHPTAWHAAPGSASGRRYLGMAASDVSVNIFSRPEKRGLTNHRTYAVDFKGSYKVTNYTPVTQTVYVSFVLPDQSTSYENFSFVLGKSGASKRSPHNATLTDAVVLAAGESTSLQVTYRTRGVDEWAIAFTTTRESAISNLR